MFDIAVEEDIAIHFQGTLDVEIVVSLDLICIGMRRSSGIANGIVCSPCSSSDTQSITETDESVVCGGHDAIEGNGTIVFDIAVEEDIAVDFQCALDVEVVVSLDLS